MNALKLIRIALDQNQARVLSLAADMKDHALVTPAPNGGNHALWIIGHLAYSEAGLLSRITGEPNPLLAWKDLLGPGSTPVADASAYPSWDEALAAMERSRTATLKLLDTLTEADLDRAVDVPEQLKAFFGTVGQSLMMIPSHTSFHAGQLADARRAIGKKPVRI